jgi:VanZ family protein
MKLRKLWLGIGLLWVVIVVVLSLIPEPPSVGQFQDIDKLEHGAAYAFLMFWFAQIYPARRTRRVIAFSFVLLGIVIECLQGLSGFRQFEYTDMAANTLGVLVGLLLALTPLGGILERFEKILLGTSRTT